MTVSVRQTTGWDLVKKAACTTMWKTPSDAEPSSEWKRKILVARHSPIEALTFMIELHDIPYWVSVHLVRHKVGVTHWVSSQRDDRHRGPVSRNDKPQGEKVNHAMFINAQALIAISRKRLCGQASPETRLVWSAVRDEVAKVDPDMAWAMRPECWWCADRCPEMRGCGMCNPLVEDFK